MSKPIEPSPARKTLLICDDDPDILGVLNLLFKPHFNTIGEPDSKKVLELARVHQPDLILVDLWMPYLSGDQLIRLLREDENCKHIRIVAISASPTGKRVALSAGANSFIPKPFEIDFLIAEVRSLIT
jgi:DNA-binding response OmpR family regulator